MHIKLNDGLVLGSAIFDWSSNTTLLFYTACYHKCLSTQSYVLRSTDAGGSWSSPGEGNLTSIYEALTMESGDIVSNLQYGEGLGANMPGQRLLVCSWFGKTLAANHNAGFAYGGIICISSDTHGKTWALAGRLSATRALAPLEPAIAPLRNGSVLLNVRDANKSHHRWQAISDDGGATFSAPWMTPVIGPVSNAAMCTVGRGTAQEQVFLANPHNLDHRENLTVFQLDQATGEWDLLQQVYPGGSGYVTSTPVAIGGSSTAESELGLGLLFEVDNCASINFVRVNVSRGAR